ncbi:MAG: sugar phosphate nucleotidyltransferase [Solirubrobacteraceae bacterium]
MRGRAVILAGGRGSRLAPYTTVIPKPLMPIGDRAILDVIVRQLREKGFDELTLAVGYLAHLIKAVFGDGSAFGVKIDYHDEKTPLGTAGALATIDSLEEPFLAMNGDVLTSLDYRALYDTHIAQRNALTIATHRRTVKTEYGVLHLDESQGGDSRRVIGYEEKPEFRYVVSMGIYAVGPGVLDLIEPNEALDFPDLVQRLLDDGRPVGSYIYDGYWLDIGRHEDYTQAVQDYDQVLAALPGLADPEAAP